MSCTHALQLGAYTLGVDDPQRGAIERHLASCAACRAELADLAEVAAMLTTARSVGVVDGDIEPNQGSKAETDPATEPDTDPVTEAETDQRAEPEGEAVPVPELGHELCPVPLSDDLLDRILAAIATERTDHQTAKVTVNRRPRRLALGIAAAVAVGGSVVGMAVLRDGLTSPDQTQLAAGTSVYGVTASTTVHDESWGTRIDMALAGLPALTSCRLVAKAHDGGTETVASWRVTYDDGLEVEGMSKYRADELAQLQVIDTTGRRLITVAATPIERKNK
ncbi:hypothetical protein ABN028_24500 [Actinopolymorpha sp. B17G11]|uniref:hypothetical protein n=1 Tax=Actinopolymorpha sp. B17G11 TaxID=3160861 RepID=UPI0032E4DC6B